MEPSRTPAIEVVIHRDGPRPNGGSQRLPRPLSVDEALRFSPMTSAPVFAVDSIMRPDIGHASLSNWSPPYDSGAAGSMIDSLDNETQSSISQSLQFKTLHSDIQRTLKGENLTNYKFKLPARLRRPHPSNPSQQSNVLTGHHLGPFAKLVLDTTDVPYSYPSASTPSPLKKGLPSKALPTPVSDRKTPQSTNRESFKHHQSISHSQSPGSVLEPVVMIPTLPASSFEAYRPIPEPTPSKKRKLDPQQEDPMEAIRIRDQREMADIALMKLQNLLQEVFEAEDQLQPDTSTEQVSSSNKFFRMTELNDGRSPVLLSESHSLLQKSLRAVSVFDRLYDIPTEYISRLQKLCEAPILYAPSIELALESVPSDSETESWLRRLRDVHNCLLSISTLLQTMSGSKNVKDLCPEDTVRSIPVALNHVFDNCIIPAVECRVNGKSSALFHFFSAHKQALGSLTNQMKRILGLLANFLSSVDLAEDTVIAVEFLIVKLIFVENAHNDKDSALGFQKYEAVRRNAMDVIAKIFAKYPDQRSFILDEILVSLEKLPSTRQSARQFKLIDGKHIQLLSALVIQLVQTTALQQDRSSRKSKRKARLSRKVTVDLEGSEEEEDESDESEDEDEVEARGLPLDRLSRQMEQLYDNATRSAQYITRFIVQRAMTSTKTGDQPYRNLLDLFTEDLINVLGSPDWPGAELLLRVLASQMVGIADHDKSPANAKNMALELLGWMGSAISELTSTAQHLSNAIDDTDTDLTKYLRQLSDDHTNRTLHVEDLITTDGPFRVALEYLEERDVGKSQLASARGYLLALWGKTVCSVYLEEGNTASNNHNAQELAKTINDMFANSRWLEVNSAFDRISTQQARLAYLLTVLSSPFCKAFDMIVKVLLGSITSEQAKVRSRSLKSVIQMLERDPSLLDRDTTIMSVIFRCATDSSPLVRDSALTLIAKCITLKPTLEVECSRAILACSADPTLGVRKRCIGLLKDIYLQTKRQDLHLSVIEKLLERMADHEESIVTLARQVVEEMWFVPFHQSIHSIQNAPQVKVSLEELVDLIVGSIRKSDTVAPSLELFVKRLLNSQDKSVQLNFDVGKAIVAVMFERVVHNLDSDDKAALSALLRSITVFAKAKATLFTPDQLETLHPYIGNLASADDLLLFRSVVVIYRCVLPNLSTAHNALLKEVQNDLFKSVSKLARTELNEVMACLWTINGVLQNTERLVRLAISVLKGIKVAQANSASSADQLGRVRSYIRIAGCVGKHCDLEKFLANFQQAFPDMKSSSVAGYMVDFIAPYTQATYPRELRLMALESLGSICQSWPAQYGRKPARVAFTSVFSEEKSDLQNVVLKSFLDFFAMHEGKLEKLMHPSESAENEPTSRLGGSLKASDNDGAAALIAQNFLKHMLNAAMSGQDSYALTAIELIASINRQGLIHPKECAGVLVALETSTNPLIAKPAFETHKMLHQQHESMFEREYMRAIQETFYYQRDIVGDPTGAHRHPFSAKLAPLFEIIKTSSSKYQKKFLTNLCSKVDFDLKKLDTSGDPPEHLVLARFISQNIASFEYGQVTELLATVTCLERIVGATGTIVAHAIETDIFPTKMDQTTVNGLNPAENGLQNSLPQCDPHVLRQLSTAASVLLMLWETRTYLRRLYNLNAHTKQKEGKANPKEMNRAPTKLPGVNADRYWEATSKAMGTMNSTEAMLATCRQFATLLSIDDELKIASEDDPDSMHSAGEMEDTGPGAVMSALNESRSMKRKSSAGAGGSTPKKPRRRRSSISKKGQSTGLEDNDLH